MTKEYEEIGFFIGNTVEHAVNELLSYKEDGKLVCGKFNGVMLYSDTVTMDSAYQTITGKTKAEFDKSQQEWKENYDREQKEHEDKIPELTKVWIERGREILSEDRWGHWDKLVPLRLNDMYRGMELGDSLDIVRILNSNGTFDEAKEKIGSQNHTGRSFSLVCAIVNEVSDRGNEFVTYLNLRNALDSVVF